MKKWIAIVTILAAGAGVAHGQPYCYGWEDGGTFIDCDNCDNMTVQNVGSHAFSGSYSLRISHDGGSYPDAYVAWITDLRYEDVIQVDLWVHDASPDATPSVRFRGAWTGSGDIHDYLAAADGPALSIGTAGGGWEMLTYTYHVPLAQDGNALAISVVPYAEAGTYGQPCYVDELCLFIPETAQLHFPGTGPVPSALATWGQVKRLFK